MARTVAVIGGGISGLAAAWELCRPGAGVEVTLLEGSDRVGGKLRLEDVGGVRIDVGAESVLARRPEALALFEELGISDLTTHPAAVGASIVSRGRRWPMPRGTVMGVPSDPESVRGLLSDEEVQRLASEVVHDAHDGDVSVGDLVDARLGPAVTDRLVEPLLAGVYAGHAREISAEQAVPALAAAARAGRPLLDVAREAVTAAASGPMAALPVFATLVGGLGRLPEVMSRELTGAGVDIRTGCVVRELRREGSAWLVTTGPTIAAVTERYDAVVLATPAAPAARLLRDVAGEAALALAGLEYASMAIVTLALDGPAPEAIDGSSGFLVPPTEPLTIKASTFSSVKWPWLAAAHPERTYLRASIGRHREEASLQRGDDELVEVALTDLHAVLGDGLPGPAATHVQRWGGGLPQYAVGHRSRLAPTRDLPPGLALCGAAYDGVGIPACIASGRAAARAVLTRWAATGAGLG
jgi:oxygen-dependent protoporphyrinogen oxidase